MNDFRDLKAIAEACQRHQPLRFMRSHGALYIRNDNGIVFDVHQNRSFPELMAQNKDYADLALAANPETILALIAENKELGRYLCTCRDCGGEGALHTGDWHSYGHMEPPEPVMEKCGECDGTGLLGKIQDLYQVITERDQLRAEIAGLRTGYEAYERVNAELKAECEWLRKHQPSAEVIWCACGDGYAANSYGAGFMAANNGVCENCDAAMGKGERS